MQVLGRLWVPSGNPFPPPPTERPRPFTHYRNYSLKNEKSPREVSFYARFKLDIFETPVTVTPQQEISQTLNSSKIPKNT